MMAELNHMMLDLNKGVEFEELGQKFVIKQGGEDPWLCYLKDGRWVSIRKANQLDINQAAKFNSSRRA